MINLHKPFILSGFFLCLERGDALVSSNNHDLNRQNTGTIQKMMKAMNSTIRAMEQMHNTSSRSMDLLSTCAYLDIYVILLSIK